MAVQAEARMQAAGTHLKQRAKKLERQPVLKGKRATEGPYSGPKGRLASHVGKTAEAEDQLIPHGVTVTRGSKWKAR